MFDEHARHMRLAKSCSDNQYNVEMTSISFLKAHVQDTLAGDTFVGPNTDKKVLPECSTPKVDLEEGDSDALTDEEKTECVLSDPKFGMFSLFKYHIKYGRHNDVLKKRNTVYCSHIFSLFMGLPVLVFVTQWIMYLAIVGHQFRIYEDGFCPNTGEMDEKMMMAAVSMFYFIKSFFMWDNIVDRTHRRKMIPSTSVIVMLDTFQEFGFNLLVYCTNLIIIYTEHDLLNMVFNTLAMEFLMQMDNEFEELYFKLLPGVGAQIFDQKFVTHRENLILVRQKSHDSRCFRLLRCVTWLPFKLLMFMFMMLPLICFVTIFVGAYCK